MTRPLHFHETLDAPHSDQTMSMVLYALSPSGAINVDAPIAKYSDFVMQSVQEADNERTQIALSSDAPKLYAFGKQHQFFIYQGFVIDTYLDKPRDLDTTLSSTHHDGRGLTKLLSFMDEARIYACARNRTIVELTYANRIVYGAFTQCAVTHDANALHTYQVVLSFFVTSALTEIGNLSVQ